MPLNHLPIIQEKLKLVKKQLDDLETERMKIQATLNKVMQAQDIANNDENNLTNLQNLADVYKQSVNESEREEELLRAMLRTINEIRIEKKERSWQANSSGANEAVRRGTLFKNMDVSARTLPLFVSRNGEKPPALCGAIQPDKNYICQKGDMVVGLVYNKEIIWMLAEVVDYNRETKTYEVEDIDEEQKDRIHYLKKDCVAPLPLMRANPETDRNALFPVGADVLALFPNSTCLYRAKVDQQPTSACDCYKVLFEDSSFNSGYSGPNEVEQRYVIAFNNTLKHALNDIQKFAPTEAAPVDF